MRRITLLLMLAWFAFWGAVSAQTPTPADYYALDQWNIKEVLFHTVYFVMIFGVPILVVWLSYSERRIATGFDLSALWRTEDGKLDRLFIIVLGTWWVHTCAITLWVLSRTVVTADFITYMGWGIPIIARMFAPQPKETP